MRENIQRRAGTPSEAGRLVPPVGERGASEVDNGGVAGMQARVRRLRSRRTGGEVLAATDGSAGDGGADESRERPGQQPPEIPGSETGNPPGGPPGGEPPREGGSSDDVPEDPRDPYTKPPFPFYQREFDGTERLSEEDRLAVLSTFERTVDGLRDRAEEEESIVAQHPDVHQRIYSAWARGADNRAASVNIHTDVEGRVTKRELVLYWDGEYVGKTTYEASYISGVSRVTRDDDTGMLPPGASSIPEGLKAKMAAEAAATEYGFNNGPIGRREIDGLQEYMGIPS